MQEIAPQTLKPKMMNLFVTGKNFSFFKHFFSLKCSALLVFQMIQIYT